MLSHLTSFLSIMNPMHPTGDSAQTDSGAEEFASVFMHLEPEDRGRSDLAPEQSVDPSGQDDEVQDETRVDQPDSSEDASADEDWEIDSWGDTDQQEETVRFEWAQHSSSAATTSDEWRNTEASDALGLDAQTSAGDVGRAGSRGSNDAGHPASAFGRGADDAPTVNSSAGFAEASDSGDQVDGIPLWAARGTTPPVPPRTTAALGSDVPQADAMLWPGSRAFQRVGGDAASTQRRAEDGFALPGREGRSDTLGTAGSVRRPSEQIVSRETADLTPSNMSDDLRTAAEGGLRRSGTDMLRMVPRDAIGAAPLADPEEPNTAGQAADGLRTRGAGASRAVSPSGSNVQATAQGLVDHATAAPQDVSSRRNAPGVTAPGDASVRSRVVEQGGSTSGTNAPNSNARGGRSGGTLPIFQSTGTLLSRDRISTHAFGDSSAGSTPSVQTRQAVTAGTDAALTASPQPQGQAASSRQAETHAQRQSNTAVGGAVRVETAVPASIRPDQGGQTTATPDAQPRAVPLTTGSIPDGPAFEISISASSSAVSYENAPETPIGRTGSAFGAAAPSSALPGEPASAAPGGVDLRLGRTGDLDPFQDRRAARQATEGPATNWVTGSRTDAVTGTSPLLEQSASAAVQTLGAGGPVSALRGQITSPHLSDSEDEEIPMPVMAATGEARSVLGPSPTIQASQPTVVRVDLAALMRQVSDGITQSGGGEIELRLSPEELGRIQMKLTNGEHGLMVHIQAERSETLDLLRRNIGDLAQDLADAGYEGAGFTFGDERPQSGEPVQIASDAGPEASAPEIQVVASSLPPSRDGIDIRI